MPARRLFWLLLAASLVLFSAHVAIGEGPLEATQSWWGRWGGAGRLGVRVQSMTPELRRYFGAPEGKGILVVQVEGGSPAAAAGFEVGDVILSASKEAIVAPHQLRFAIAAAPANATLELEIVRRGEPSTLEVTLRSAPHPALDSERWRQLREHIHPGIRRGAGDLLKRFQELERRMRELEKRMEQANPKPSE